MAPEKHEVMFDQTRRRPKEDEFDKGENFVPVALERRFRACEIRGGNAKAFRFMRAPIY